MGKPSILQRDKATTAIGNMLLQVDGSVSPKAAYRVLLLVVVAFIASLLTVVPSVDAIVNGVDATGDSAVVTLMPGEVNPQSYCTGVYFQEYAVVTAAHCVVAHNGRRGEWRFPLNQLYVAQPGVDWKTPQAVSTRVRVLRIWVPEKYFNRYNPSLGEVETQIDDIAFLFLEKPLNGRPVSGFASSTQVDAFRNGNGTALHLGYGCLGIPEGSTQLEQNDGKPYRADNINGTRRGLAHITAIDRHLQVDYPIGKSLCPGDSGSPLFLNQPDNQLLYVGVIFAGNGWEEARKAHPKYQSVGDITTFYPFASLFDVEYAKFLAEINELLAQEQEKRTATAKLLTAAKENGNYTRSPGCHAVGISAAVEVRNSDGSWTTHNDALGWESSDTGCPSTHPVTPWTIITLANSSTIRWKYSGVGWTTYSTASEWIRIAAVPTTTTTTVAPRDQLLKRTVGTKCLNVGAKRKVGNKTLTCKKVSKLLKWVA